jgi:hypothetical protein
VWLLDLAFHTDLTAKLDDFKTELQGGNKTVIKTTNTAGSFNGKLKLWNTSLMKGVVTNFRSVQSRAYGTLDASVYDVAIDNPLEGLQRRFKDFDFTQFSVSFNTNSFQERDVSWSTELCRLCSCNTERDRRLLISKQNLSLQAKANDSVL